ncbi:endopeptidase SpoIID/LytB [Pueribacillus theae]|uniref:Endopeptidase SpoIID/LytB n=1 Tax=Pueribacillus theae TaxID=2171751 RepID=A0A2U1JT68_9BACI|nr:peptidoglycan-binding protein [Pueribacillus theae]PWA08396.1 endopeptidase SpoIID/LytB [Pueribacillus theae]
MANKWTSKLVISSAFAAGAIFAAPSIGEAALGDRTLKEGTSDNDVKELQDILKSKGYFTYETSTGYFGSITKEALVRFQADANLPRTGIADKATLQALMESNVKSSKEAPEENGSSNKLLRIGSVGPDVTNLQNKLQAAGYHTAAVDGIYGSQTAQSVRNFQKAKGLKVDGIVGPETLSALEGSNGPTAATPLASEQPSSTNSTILRINSKGQAVTNLQNGLKQLGYHASAVDGIYGPLTAQAVRSFQQANGLEVDGIAGPETLSALKNGKAASKPASKPEATPSEESSAPSPSSSVLKKESAGQAVAQLQSNLKRLGFFSANATGFYGDITAQAVTNFQRAHGLSVDGAAGPETLNKLNNVLNGKDTEAVKGSSFNVMNLVADASAYIGVPYVWGGTTPKGFDCSGFIQYVFKKQNVNLPRTVSQMWNAGKDVSKPQVGDIVFYETYNKGPSHAGIYIGNNKFIQAGTSTGVTITDMNNSYWKPRYLGVKRLH